MTNTKTASIQAWIQRRRMKGVEPTADEIWYRIYHNWPSLSDANREEIFQGVK